MVKYWQEQKRVLLMLTLASLVIMVLFEAQDMKPYFSPLTELTQRNFFLAGLLLLLPIYSFSFFGFMSRKEKATEGLLLPASHLEKMIVTILYTTIIITLLWIVVFFAVNEMMVRLLNSIAVKDKIRYFSMFDDGKFLPRSSVSLKSIIKDYQIPIVSAFIFQAFALLGAIFFKKYSVVKTIAIVFILIVFFLPFLQLWILPLLFDSKFQFDGFDKYKITLPRGTFFYSHNYLEKGKYILISSPLKEIASWGFYYGIWIFLTVITFFKLKEKQV